MKQKILAIAAVAVLSTTLVLASYSQMEIQVQAQVSTEQIGEQGHGHAEQAQCQNPKAVGLNEDCTATETYNDSFTDDRWAINDVFVCVEGSANQDGTCTFVGGHGGVRYGPVPLVIAPVAGSNAICANDGGADDELPCIYADAGRTGMFKGLTLPGTAVDGSVEARLTSHTITAANILTDGDVDNQFLFTLEDDCSDPDDAIGCDTADQFGTVSARTLVVSTILSKGANPECEPADACPTGTTVTYKYNETNDGSFPLSNPDVEDDTCSPVTPITKAGGFNIGDTDSDNLLDPGETWMFECTKQYNTPGTFTNTAIGHGDFTNQTGTFDICEELANCQDTDEIDRFTVTIIPRANTTLIKSVNDTEGFSPLDVRYRYNEINTGSAHLINVVITDNRCSPVTPVLSGGFNVGDSDMDNVLDPNENWEFECFDTIVSPPDPTTVTNTASAEADVCEGVPVNAAACVVIAHFDPEDDPEDGINSNLDERASTTVRIARPESTASDFSPDAGDAVTDSFRITFPAGATAPSGSVDFFLCGPVPVVAVNICDVGGTFIGTDLAPSVVGLVATWTSPAFNIPDPVTPADEGKYCWRGEYNGDSNYAPTEHTNDSTECFLLVPVGGTQVIIIIDE